MTFPHTKQYITILIKNKFNFFIFSKQYIFILPKITRKKYDLH
jgi:hypothetical protein